MKFRFLADARIEMIESARYYDQQRYGAGLRFITATLSCAQAAAEHPLRGNPAAEDCRRRAISRYPYWLVYRIEQMKNECAILIVAVVHHRRQPEYWLDRIH